VSCGETEFEYENEDSEELFWMLKDNELFIEDEV